MQPKLGVYTSMDIHHGQGGFTVARKRRKHGQSGTTEDNKAPGYKQRGVLSWQSGPWTTVVQGVCLDLQAKDKEDDCVWGLLGCIGCCIDSMNPSTRLSTFNAENSTLSTTLASG